MKKIIVLVALVTLTATSAFAAISGSAHDLSGAGTGLTEVCAFCHTPHNGGTQAPLWNRGDGITPLQVYSSTTMNVTSGGVASDANLCLSCHDAASAAGITLSNLPNGVTWDGTPMTALMTGDANLGTDLSNDHPVGFDYTTSSGADGGINNAIGDSRVATFSDIVWCSSCHDVHDNTNAPFLVMSNANSALCLACHNK